MSGSLLEIRKKIGGVRNTRKITKAMQLVAASKMRQFQKRAVTTRHYVWDLLALLEHNLTDRGLYSEVRSKGKTLFVVYSSDKGLCGPLNNKILQATFRSSAWNSLGEDERLLITLGKKSNDFAKNNRIPVHKHYTGISEKLSTLDVVKVVDGILELWNSKEVKNVIFIAPHYKNSFTFYPVLKTFLPFSQETIDSTLGPLEAHERPASFAKMDEEMTYEPSKPRVIKRLHEQLIHSLFMQAFLELKASEYSSRMIAMQNATDSADRMITDLTKDYNKARQQAITSEIAELIGASDAIASS